MKKVMSLIRSMGGVLSLNAVKMISLIFPRQFQEISLFMQIGMLLNMTFLMKI